MSWLAVGARLLVGLAFTVLGLNGLMPQPFIDMPKTDMPPEALQFATLLVASGYLKVVKGLEVIGGLLLLSGRATPLGVVVLMPIAVNILLYEVFLLGKPGPGVVLVALLTLLIAAYWRYFAPVVTFSATTRRPAVPVDPA